MLRARSSHSVEVRFAPKNGTPSTIAILGPPPNTGRQSRFVLLRLGDN